MKNTDIYEMKRGQLKRVAQVRERLRKTPDLVWLFFELTTVCNLQCRHCGSSCRGNGICLEPDMITKALEGLDPRRVCIALTGGEPMLYPQLYEICRAIKDRGFRWGMTSNATLIDRKAAERLKEVGLGSVSVSLDGMEASHDWMRRREGAWRQALAGIHALMDVGIDPQVTTVIHPKNLSELEQMEGFLRQEGIRSWRIINVEPIGRARDSELLPDRDTFRTIIRFIRERRSQGDMDVTFGCSHYLGVDTERMVRDEYFLCGAGITVASIRANGDICACLDIENRPELVQGNIHTDSFMDVWKNRFRFFRQDRTQYCAKCMECPDREICGGDSTHTWDFDRNEPMLCGKEFMEDR